MTFECDGCVCNECNYKYNDRRCGKCNGCGWKEDGEPSFEQTYKCDGLELNK